MYMYTIMKTMYTPAYHHYGFVTTHAFWHTMYDYTLQVTMNQRVFSKQARHVQEMFNIVLMINVHLTIVEIHEIYHCEIKCSSFIPLIF